MSPFRLRRVLVVGPALAVLCVWASFYLPIPRSRLRPGGIISLRIEDRKGELLREVLSDDGGRCRWLGLSDMSRYLIKATIAAEDSHFFSHPGVNPYAVTRAFVQNLRNRRVVSGGSTITQQVVRNIYRFRRNLIVKVAEAWLAVRLEHTLNKEGILVQYLNRIAYGNQVFGIEAASRLYFDKPAADLGLAESAFLTVLPRAPSEFNPYRNFAAAVKRQREILERMHELGDITVDELRGALGEPIAVRPADENFRAPHFCDFVLSALPDDRRHGAAIIRTTLDFALQAKVEILLRQHLAGLENRRILSGAVLVMDNRTGDILAMVGSPDFFDNRRSGQVNGTCALRQPGSTLKPLTYALALERGMTAATILDDVPTEFATLEGSFAPENYDEKFHGAIRLRSALASSYNVPAVAVLQMLGPDLLYQRLKALEFSSLRREPGFYGVGLTLGNGEASLRELVRAYGTLARGGYFLRDRTVDEIVMNDGHTMPGDPITEPEPVVSAEASYIITNILSDRDARVPGFGYRSPLDLPFPAAAKTGTSKDYRDNWTIGYTPRHTIGVWVGNFDGRAMQNVSGISGAGPLFRDVMILLADGRSEAFAEPRTIIRTKICPLSGELPAAACPSAMEEIFVRGTEPKTTCSFPHGQRTTTGIIASFSAAAKPRFAIVFPQEGDVFKIDPILRRAYQSVRFRAAVPADWPVRSFEWYLNGRRLAAADVASAPSWNLAPGSYTIQLRIAFNTESRWTVPVRFTVVS